MGTLCKWTNDSQRFLLEHFDTIHNSPSHIYHSALPFSPSSSLLCKYYGLELSQEVQVVKGLPAEWGACSRVVSLHSIPYSFACWNNTIAVGSDLNIIILNIITGSQTAVLSGHTDCVPSVTYSLDGVSLVSGSHDKTIKLWDVQTGGVIKTFYGHTWGVTSVSISADCTMIASGSWDGTIHLWNIQTGECHCIIWQGQEVKYVSFHHIGPQHLLSVCNGRIWQWDINGHQAGPTPTYDGYYVSFSQDGAQSLSYKGETVTVQNSSSGVVVAEFQISIPISWFCLSPDGRLVAVVSHNTTYIFDIANSGTHLIEAIVDTEPAYLLAFFSSSLLVLGFLHGYIKFYQISAPSGLATTHPKPTFPASHEIRSMTLQAKDGIVITGDLNGVVKTWDIFTGLCRASFQTPVTLDNQDIYTVLSGDRLLYHEDVQLINGRLIIVWLGNQKINAWDVERGELLFAVDGPDELEALKISGDGSRVFCLGKGFIQALSVQTGEIVGMVDLNGSSYGPLTVDDSRVWIYDQGWDFGTLGSLPIQLSNISLHKFHPNGVVLWDNDLCRIKDTITGKVVFQLSTKYGKPVDVQWNGQYLVACFLPLEVLILDFSYIL